LRDFKPEGGENWNEVQERSRMLINDLIAKYIKKDFVENIEIMNNISNNIVGSSNNNSTKNNILKKQETINPNANKGGFLKKTLTLTMDKFTKHPKPKNIPESEITINKGKNNDMIELKKMNSQGMNLNSNANIYEYEYMNKDLGFLFENPEFQKKMSKIYNGYNPDLNFPRVLIVSHGGFIMEFLNSIRKKKNIRIKFINDSKPTSLYIVRIYCVNCGGVCYSKDETCRLDYDMILFNDIEHLGEYAPLVEIGK
jgi:hypothetical protein